MNTWWSSFKTTPLGELLTGTAHQAHPADPTAALGARFEGQTIIAVYIAMEKAATVRVSFGRDGGARLGVIRNIKQRASSEFAETLRSEAAATRAEWALVVVSTGWQASIGQRAARADPAEGAGGFVRYRLMLETPEVVVPRAQVDRVYTAVDHPAIDRSVVFSLRRRDLDEIFAEVRRCGLGIAGVRIPVAAQLESWLAEQGEAGLTRDLLLTDGLSALLLNLQHGDFVPPPSAVEVDLPRQAVQRPSALDEDIARFINANLHRSVTFVGPEELCAAVKKRAPETEIVRPSGVAAHDVQTVIVGAQIQHDLNYEAREARPALPRTCRRFVLGYAVIAAVLAMLAIINVVYAARVGYQSYQLELAAAQRRLDTANDDLALSGIATELLDAGALRSWVATNFSAQRLCYHVLRDIPENAALDRLTVEAKDGQIAFGFVVLGDQATQLATRRAVENAIKDLRFKIGGEELPVTAPGVARAVQYRLHLITPDAGEVEPP